AARTIGILERRIRHFPWAWAQHSSAITVPSVGLGLHGNRTWTGRDSALPLTLLSILMQTISKRESATRRHDMAHPAVDALRVRAHGDAVRTLRDQGLTWVTFDPIPDLVCDVDFGIRKLPELGLLSGTVRGVRHVHAQRDSGDGNDNFTFHLNVSGLSTVVSRRGEATLQDGDAMLMSYSAGRTVNRP